MYLLRAIFSSFIGVIICWLIMLACLGLNNGSDYIWGLLIYYLPILLAATLVTYFILTFLNNSGLVINFLVSIRGFLILFGLFSLLILFSAIKIFDEDVLLWSSLFYGLAVSTTILSYFEKKINL